MIRHLGFPAAHHIAQLSTDHELRLLWLKSNCVLYGVPDTPVRTSASRSLSVSLISRRRNIGASRLNRKPRSHANSAFFHVATNFELLLSDQMVLVSTGISDFVPGTSIALGARNRRFPARRFIVSCPLIKLPACFFKLSALAR